MTPEERRKAAQAGLSTGPSYEDMIDEAKFHYVVDRKPLRSQSEAWGRVSSSVNGDTTIPLEMESWVDSEPLVVNGDDSKPPVLNGDDNIKKEKEVDVNTA